MTARPSPGPRLVVIDDNPHVHWGDRHYPVDATFDQFLPALLDASPGVGSIVHCVPTRGASTRPATLPTDPRVQIVETAPFDGIAGYLRAAPRLVRANARILRPVIAEADLVWIKVPASNAAVAGWLAARSGVARFGYVAGSALAVARARRMGLPAQAVGLLYDVVGRVAGGRHRIVVGEDIVTGAGVVTSLVESSEVRDRDAASWPAAPGRFRLAWAGRLAPGKGLDTLLDSLARLAATERGFRSELVVLGGGTGRQELEERARRLDVADRVTWRGYVADRAGYLDALAPADAFVFPSGAEGFPKVILDAMAVGVPVLARLSSKPLRSLADAGLIRPMTGTAAGIEAAIVELARDPERAAGLRASGLAFARRHTRAAEAGRLVDTLRSRFPDLPWASPPGQIAPE